MTIFTSRKLRIEKDDLDEIKGIEPRRFLLVFIVTTILIFILILISGVIITSKAENQLLASSASLGSQVQEVSGTEFNIKKHLIEPGEVFSKLNTALGLNDQQLKKILTASKTAYDLAQIRAGNKIQAFFDLNSNEFQKLEYEIDQNNILIIEKSENNELKAKKIAIEYEIQLTKVSGTIKETLYQTGQNLGLSDKTIMEMADIFAWDIDFGFEVREGDKFELLYEKRYLHGQEVSPGKILIAYYQNQDEDHWAVYYQDFEDKEDYYDLEGNCLRRQFLKSPINYKYISSGYSLNRYHPIWKKYTTHRAIDYAAACGTPISASGAGTVTFVGWKNNVYGQTVIIRHNDVYTTRYVHLSAYGRGIRYGAKVTQGQIIGFVGTTGTSTGCHLDYAMMKHGSFVNPLTQNFKRAEPIKKMYRGDFEFNKRILRQLLAEN